MLTLAVSLHSLPVRSSFEEIEEGERGVGPPRMSPEDVGDSSPDSAKMEAGQVMRDHSSSKFEIEIDDFRASGVELDGQAARCQSSAR